MHLSNQLKQHCGHSSIRLIPNTESTDRKSLVLISCQKALTTSTARSLIDSYTPSSQSFWYGCYVARKTKTGAMLVNGRQHSPNPLFG